MTKKLINNVQNRSHLCLGIDITSLQVKQYLGLIKEHKCKIAAIKLNLAFWLNQFHNLKPFIEQVKENDPEQFVILDGKFGDIDNTMTNYADFVYNYLGVDGCTVHYVMGMETLKPFLDFKDKLTFAVYHPTSKNSLLEKNSDEELIMLEMISSSSSIKNVPIPGFAQDNLGIVVRPDSYFTSKENWKLIPGVGKQGYTLDKSKLNDKYIVNVGRSVAEAENPGEELEKYAELVQR